MTPEELKAIIRFKWVSHITTQKGAASNYRDDQLNCSMQIHTPRQKGHWGKEQRIFFIDGDTIGYTSSQEFLAALASQRSKNADS